MTSEDLTHRAAVRTGGKYNKNVDQYTLQICTVVVLLNCISDICRMCQKRIINNNTVTVWAVITKTGGWVNKEKIQK